QHGVPAKGWLMGGKHEGIRQMFLVIEYARMMVGTKAIATLSTGYLNALDYARQRVQGPDMLRAMDKTAPRVTIIHHPDVRRSLLLQKSYAEGLRALVCYAATWQDKMWTADQAGDAEAFKAAERINDLLLPIVKGVGSERAYELLGHESLQTFGGSGFLQDYPLEQYLRDSKIDTLYEGTTAIQSLDLFFRKIVKDRGVALMTVAGEIREFIDRDGELKPERQALAEAFDQVQAMLGTMTGWLQEYQAGEERVLYKVGLSTRRLLLALGDLLVGWLLLRQAEVALAKLDGADGADRAFYEGKVAAARFFAREVLPRLAADRRVVEGATLDAMDLPEEAFWASIRRRRPSGQPGRWAGSRAGGPANDQPAHQAGGPAHGQLTHSSVPSAKTCRFHTGRRALTSSTSRAQAANASARCAQANAAAGAASPPCRPALRWESATT